MGDLQHLYSELILVHHNLRMLHWNVYGEGFDKAHEKFDDYTKKINEFIDEIAEIMKIESIEPLDLLSALKLLDDDEHTDIVYIKTGASFTSSAAFIILGDMFMSLLNTYRSISNMTSDIQGKLDEHMYYLRLELRYKNNMRTGGPDKL